MRRPLPLTHRLNRRLRLLLPCALLAFGQLAAAEPRHGIAMYGTPALPPDFTSLPQANPEAPKGGLLVLGEAGTFDSLNPFITLGSPVPAVAPLTVETLMGRSYDEPFSLYGLLAETIDTDEARSYVEFTLREQARFSDGSPVTVEDVIWSMETLGTIGNPRYHAAWKKVDRIEATGPRSVRITFNTVDRELPLLFGLRPILSKAQWEGKDFETSRMEPVIGSGPYVIERVEPGSSVTFRRNPDWWGKDLPFNRGLWNFDRIRYHYFVEPQAQYEAFTSGTLSSYRETSITRWENLDAVPAVQEGRLIKSEIPHQRPSGIEGFAFNTRRPLFQDWRVREALILAFDFDFINQSLNAGKLPRITSYFSNSPFGYTPGTPAEGRVAELLAPFADELPPGTLEGYELPKTEGKSSARRNLRKAQTLLEEAGWHPDDKGVLRNAAGEPFAFEILLTIGQDAMENAARIYVESLKALGIEAKISLLDTAQMKVRTDAFDFDMTHYIRTLSLSPGLEQKLYWGAAQAEQNGSRNWPGIRLRAVDVMIDEMLRSEKKEDFDAAVQALDRVLTAGRFVIPVWYADRARIAHSKNVHFPAKIPLYGDWTGFQPDLWWYEEE